MFLIFFYKINLY